MYFENSNEKISISLKKSYKLKILPLRNKPLQKQFTKNDEKEAVGKCSCFDNKQI